MVRQLFIALLTATMLMGSASLVSADALADFKKGYAAYKAGNFAQALTWFRKAAEQGNAKAQNNLGVMYDNGEGVTQDYAEALKWYRKAALQGHAIGQNNIGRMHEIGRGITQDYAQAMKWYRKAAEQGDAIAQYSLGRMYYKGQGVARDYSQAAKRYRKVADQGDTDLQFNLDLLHNNGQGGVSHDYIKAHMWWNIAATTGFKAAVKKRDIVAKRMTPTAIAEAQKRARICLKSNYKRCD